MITIEVFGIKIGNIDKDNCIGLGYVLGSSEKPRKEKNKDQSFSSSILNRFFPSSILTLGHEKILAFDYV
jgi:hypothetical protein